ncbi:Thioredoxin [Popillia japonica]|uniref:Thioredoxin n=1 Tax=Popillia japonica TaxID=7064 RepID=A0AAW1LX31_POPJA
MQYFLSGIHEIVLQITDRRNESMTRVVHSIRSQNNVGWIMLAISTCITVTLVIIPTDSKYKDPQSDQDSDYRVLYKTILLIILIISSFLGCIFFFFMHYHDDFLSKVMKSEIPVVVNFHANWCEPCHILTPKLIELVSDKDNVDLVTIDVEIHAELAHIFEVKAVPAVLAVKNGLVIDKSIGLIDASMLEKLINNVVNK